MHGADVADTLRNRLLGNPTWDTDVLDFLVIANVGHDFYSAPIYKALSDEAGHGAKFLGHRYKQRKRAISRRQWIDERKLSEAIAKHYGKDYLTLSELRDAIKNSESVGCFAGLTCYTLSVLNRVVTRYGLEAIAAGPKAAPRFIKKYGLERHQRL